MIANAKEYQITQEEAHKFEEALALLDTEQADLSPRLRQAMRESMESTLAELRAQITEYQTRGQSRPRSAAV